MINFFKERSLYFCRWTTIVSDTKQLVRLITPIFLLGLAWAQAPKAAPPQSAPAKLQAPASKEHAPEQKMALLVIRSQQDGVPLFLDDEQLGETPMPMPWTLPPGPHLLIARPKGAPVERHELMLKAGMKRELEILRRTSSPSNEPSVKVIHRGAGFSLKSASYVSGGVSLAALATGLYFGMEAQSSAQEAQDLDHLNATRSDELRLTDEAESAAFKARVSFGLAGISLLSAATLFLLSEEPPLQASVSLQGAMLGGRF